jgi:hypothetical protein
MNLDQIVNQSWFQGLPHEQRELLRQSLFLLEDMEHHPRQFFDYSFVVMPAAKAYEGFVKDAFLHLRLISEAQYQGTRFRVGKSLNPELEKIPRYKEEALYQELADLFGDETVPQKLWLTWKRCRNRTFHYFTKQRKAVTLAIARERVGEVLATIQLVLTHPQYRAHPGGKSQI